MKKKRESILSIGSDHEQVNRKLNLILYKSELGYILSGNHNIFLEVTFCLLLSTCNKLIVRKEVFCKLTFKLKIDM